MTSTGNAVSKAAAASAAALAAHPLVTAPLGLTLRAFRAVRRLKANIAKAPHSYSSPPQQRPSSAPSQRTPFSPHASAPASAPRDLAVATHSPSLLSAASGVIASLNNSVTATTPPLSPAAAAAAAALAAMSARELALAMEEGSGGGDGGGGGEVTPTANLISTPVTGDSRSPTSAFNALVDDAGRPIVAATC